MEVSTLKVEAREALGSNHTTRLRQSGKVPAIVYGGEAEPVNVALAGADLERELAQVRGRQVELQQQIETRRSRSTQLQSRMELLATKRESALAHLMGRSLA